MKKILFITFILIIISIFANQTLYPNELFLSTLSNIFGLFSAFFFSIGIYNFFSKRGDLDSIKNSFRTLKIRNNNFIHDIDENHEFSDISTYKLNLYLSLILFIISLISGIITLI